MSMSRYHLPLMIAPHPSHCTCTNSGEEGAMATTNKWDSCVHTMYVCVHVEEEYVDVENGYVEEACVEGRYMEEGCVEEGYTCTEGIHGVVH